MKRELLGLLLSATCAAGQAQSLGRLFYTEEERARLDARRGQPAETPSAPQTVGTVRHDGFVSRSSGRPTWFVNGAAADPEALTRLPARVDGNTLQLQGASGAPVRLKPGERAAISADGHASPEGPNIDVRPGPAQ